MMDGGGFAKTCHGIASNASRTLGLLDILCQSGVSAISLSQSAVLADSASAIGYAAVACSAIGTCAFLIAGGPPGTRTRNMLIKSQLLCRLS